MFKIQVNKNSLKNKYENNIFKIEKHVPHPKMRKNGLDIDIIFYANVKNKIKKFPIRFINVDKNLKFFKLKQLISHYSGFPNIKYNIIWEPPSNINNFVLVYNSEEMKDNLKIKDKIKMKNVINEIHIVEKGSIPKINYKDHLFPEEEIGNKKYENYIFEEKKNKY